MSAGLSFWIFMVLVCGSSVVCGSSEGLKITKEPGENVTLTCKTGNNHRLIVLEWNREGLGNKTVFVVRDEKPYLDDQHESYKNRVFLKDSLMKNGNLSVVLKNVTIKDTGTYECKVNHEHDPQRELKVISTVRLFVVPPGGKEQVRGDQDEKNKDEETKNEGMSPGVLAGIIVPSVLVVSAVGFWIYKKKICSNQSSSGSNNQQNPEQDHLNSDSTAERNTSNTNKGGKQIAHFKKRGRRS